MKSSLKKETELQVNWSQHLENIQYTLNNTSHSSINNTPSKLLLGYDMKNQADSKFLSYFRDIIHKEDLQLDRQKAREIAIKATNKLKEYNKVYYDKKHKVPTKYNIGDYVLIRDTIIKPGEDRKLKPPYKGPYMVTKVLNHNRYVIQDIPGFNIKQKPYNSILSPDRMKPWVKPPSKLTYE